MGVYSSDLSICGMKNVLKDLGNTLCWFRVFIINVFDLSDVGVCCDMCVEA